MRTFLLLCAFILFNVELSFSQEGHFYLTNHIPRSVTFENTNFKIVQSSRGVLYIANNRGLISYDGYNWEFIETPEAVFSLAIDSNDKIFIGGQTGFGRLVADGNTFEYQSLSDSIVSSNEIFDIREHLGKVYFLNQKSIFIYEDGNINELRLEDAAIFRTLAPLPDKMLAITNDGRVFSTLGGLNSYDTGLDYDHQLEATILSPDQSQAILVDSDGSLFLHGIDSLTQLEFNDAEVLKELIVSAGVWLDEGIVAIGSLESGVVFLDLNTFTILEILNYDSGLPDNQIFSMTRDKLDNSLWISHSYGFSRVSPFLPFRSFGRFPGINGKLLTGYFKGDTIYVGTSVGLYKLIEVIDFKERITYVPVRINNASSADDEVAQEEDTDRKRRRGLFGRRRDKEEETNSGPTENQTEVRLERRVTREEGSKHWEYEKVDGIDSKVLKLEGAPDGLIVASLSGLFELKEGKTEPISPEPFSFALYLEGQNGVIGASADGGVYYFTKSGESWIAHKSFYEIEDYIQYIFSDSDNNIWLLGPNVVYRTTLFQNELMDLEFWPIENPFYSNNLGSEINGQVYIYNSNALYTYNETSKVIEKRENTNLWAEFPDRALPGFEGTVWIHDGKDWSPLGSPYLPSRPIKPISLFNDVSFLNYDRASDSFWIITGENDLYKMSNKDTIVQNHLPLILREVKNGQTHLPLEDQFEIQQNQNSITFNLLKPDYDNLFKIEYRYKLEGLNSDWSDWSDNFNSVSFPFLPDGDYTLNFESRDVFGQINRLEPYSFKIVPPYWKRPWFYGLEIIAFGSLFLLSFRLNRIGHKYKFLSKLLAFLTLILAVEFIQTVAELKFSSGGSPVTSFFIQVFIALVFLPLEGVVRRAVFRIEEAQELKGMAKKGH